MLQLANKYLIGVKRLVSVEVDSATSNQHEFNGTSALRQVLGNIEFRGKPTSWFLLRDDGVHNVESHSMSWYDSRKNDPSRSAEWRLYYAGTTEAQPDDLLVIVADQSGDLKGCFIVPRGSSWESQLLYSFGNPDIDDGMAVTSLRDVDIFMATVVEEMISLLGLDDIPTPEREVDLDLVIHRFPDGFPSTREFSKFARETVIDVGDDPDDVLMAWWSAEDALFRTLEQVGLRERLDRFPPFRNVEDFLAFSLSIQNRRKSRAGQAFENHLEALFAQHEVSNDRGAKTEGNRRPDFIFPGTSEYQDPAFGNESLTMLGAKTTCKDRWRQVLTEAALIKKKHLCTLEGAISSEQLAEMKEEELTLVVPRPIQRSYSPGGITNLMTISEFLQMVIDRQRKLPH